jgi:hypothetical protein
MAGDLIQRRRPQFYGLTKPSALPFNRRSRMIGRTWMCSWACALVQGFRRADGEDIYMSNKTDSVHAHRPVGGEYVQYERSGAVSIDLKGYLKSTPGKSQLDLTKKLGNTSPSTPVEHGRLKP